MYKYLLLVHFFPYLLQHLIFSGKISVKVLSPLYRHPKNPILRGDTGGGRGTPIG